MGEGKTVVTYKGSDEENDPADRILVRGKGKRDVHRTFVEGVPNEDVPQSVLDAIEDGIKGHEFEITKGDAPAPEPVDTDPEVVTPPPPLPPGRGPRGAGPSGQSN